jgi:hypothetical protein
VLKAHGEVFLYNTHIQHGTGANSVSNVGALHALMLII